MVYFGNLVSKFENNFRPFWKFFLCVCMIFAINVSKEAVEWILEVFGLMKQNLKEVSIPPKNWI